MGIFIDRCIMYHVINVIYDMDIRFINKNSKSPTHGAEIYGKSPTKPHYSPGGGEWGFSLIGALILASLIE